MNYRIISYIIGCILEFEAGFLILPAAVGLLYKEPESSLAFVIVSVLCLALSFLLKRFKAKRKDLSTREGFLAVALSWLTMSVFGAIPFMITGEIPDFVDALFETSSGFTTTGASILSDVEALSHASLFWRSFTHWIGGMGVFVFIMAILPLMGASTMNLMRAESPGPSVGKLVPRVKDTAKILYELYFGVTLAAAVAFLLSGMDLFNSLTITFGTVGTGGFGIYNSSIADYTPLQQNLITIFMILSGVNYTLFFCIIKRRFKEAFSIEEVKWYFFIILISAGTISLNIRSMYPTFQETLKHSFFQVASLITTTGFSTVDFNLWPELSRMILIFLMFVGGCAGSTAGGLKVSRIVILLKSIKRELSKIIHPRLIKKISSDGHVLTDETLHSTHVYIAVYFIVLLVSTLFISVDELDFTTNFTAVLASLNNIGPGLNLVGPTCNFGVFSCFSKCVLIFDMLAGRLELYPMLILFLPSCWKKY